MDNDKNIQNIENGEVSTVDEVTVESVETTDVQRDNNTVESDVAGGEPTLTFDAVAETNDKTSSDIGIKVFFVIIAVIAMLVVAISVGYIFGRKSNVNNLYYNSSTQLQNKGDATQSSLSEIYTNLSQSVAMITIYSEDNGIEGYASGVVYNADGYIVTNDHIYSEVVSPKFLVTFSDGKEYEAQFVAGDTRSDLAVLKIEALGLKPATFGNSEQLVVGEQVVTLGYPSGSGIKPIFTSGTVSATGIRVRLSSSYQSKMIQTDSPINPGSSGGALVNLYSQVIGITSAKLAGSEYDSVGYAIPSASVVKIVDSLISNGYVVDRGKLGITYSEIDTVLSEINNIPRGLYIYEVLDESEFVGKLSKGDVITHINDVEIVRSDIALDIIESTAPGVPMSFTVYRASSGKTETVFASLVEDQGSSSYTTKITDDNNAQHLPFTEDDDNSFSDH